MLAFLNDMLQDGGTSEFDVGKGFKMKLPPNLDPQKKARLLNAMKTFGVRPIDN